MKALRCVTALAVVLVTSAVSGAPPAAAPAPVRTIRTTSLVPVKPADAEVAVAKAHVFKPPNVAQVLPEDQDDKPSLKLRVRRQKTPSPKTPKLNVAQFGEDIHAAFKDNVRGYALGLRKNGQPILTLIWDWARTPQQGGKGWNLDTRMHVASVSKLITGIVATKMLTDRGLSFDTKIDAYLPTYWDEANSSENLTFRQLLRHQAGFTIYDGDYLSFKRQVEQGVIPNAPVCKDGVPQPCRLGYTNGSFSLVRVLTATMTGAVNKNWKWDMPGNLPSVIEDQFNDAMWDIKTTEAFLAYAQQKVFNPSGVSNVSSEPTSTSALAYSGKTDTSGWNSGNVRGQLGGAGFRLSVNEVLNVMGTFRRKGTIVSPTKAKEAIEGRIGLDQVIDTPAGKIYNKNGAWRTGASPSADIEQCVAYYLQEDMELVVFVNSWVGSQQASLRGTIKDAYIANLE